MNWTELLKAEIEDVYRSTEHLMKKADDLSWKPSDENNWMSMGQLLLHCTNACGFCVKGFVTGEWDMPEGESTDGMPPASSMPAVESIDHGLKLLAEDKALALRMIDEAGEDELATRPAPAPWDPSDVKLGRRLLGMVNHLAQHKDQLYYYLKLQGQPVNTFDLYAMAP